ncbi:hypothetical protein D9M71_738320 [compost metagenome]
MNHQRHRLALFLDSSPVHQLKQRLFSPWSNLQAQVFFLHLRGLLAPAPVALGLVHRHMTPPLNRWAASEHAAAGGAAG